MCNGHWNYGRGTVFSLLFILLIGAEFCRGRRWRPWLLAVLLVGCVVHLAIGIRLRVLEARRSVITVEWQATFEKYRAQRSTPAVTALTPQAVMAGEQSFINLAVLIENVRSLSGPTFLSPSIDNALWDERETLQASRWGKIAPSLKRTRNGTLRPPGWGRGCFTRNCARCGSRTGCGYTTSLRLT